MEPYAITTDGLPLEALRFAMERHNGQVRKYTGEPYVSHLAEVAGLVATVTSALGVIAAAYLHDIIEDTPTTIDEFAGRFGIPVARMVGVLTRADERLLAVARSVLHEARRSLRQWARRPDPAAATYTPGSRGLGGATETTRTRREANEKPTGPGARPTAVARG